MLRSFTDVRIILPKSKIVFHRPDQSAIFGGADLIAANSEDAQIDEAAPQANFIGDIQEDENALARRNGTKIGSDSTVWSEGFR